MSHVLSVCFMVRGSHPGGTGDLWTKLNYMPEFCLTVKVLACHNHYRPAEDHRGDIVREEKLGEGAAVTREEGSSPELSPAVTGRWLDLS